MRILTRQHFGLAADPWARLHVDTADHLRVAGAIAAGAGGRILISIAGPRGAGKTHAVKRALGEDVALVETARLTRERLHMGDVEQAVVRDLSDERPRRSAEARSHQVRRILGDRRRRGDRVALLIDDAHVLHHNTVRAMKRLLELSWRGLSPLLSVVLVGQTDAAARIPEVGLRADSLHMTGLSAPEAREALDRAINGGRRKLLDADGLDLLAAAPAARFWLDLQRLADDCLAEALRRGAERIDADVVDAVLHPRRDAGAPAAPAPVDEDLVDRAIAAIA